MLGFRHCVGTESIGVQRFRAGEELESESRWSLGWLRSSGDRGMLLFLDAGSSTRGNEAYNILTTYTSDSGTQRLTPKAPRPAVLVPSRKPGHALSFVLGLKAHHTFAFEARSPLL